MIEEQVRKELSAYLEYIKEVFIIEYGKILSEKKQEYIKNIKEQDLEIDTDSEYKIRVNNKIKFCLNINQFIANNHFEKEDFKDIQEDGLKKINYYLDHRNDVLTLVKDSLLENIILYFINGNQNNVFTLGVADYIAKKISKKYNLMTLNSYEKECELFSHLVAVVGEEKALKSIFNDDLNILEKEYNQYIPALSEYDHLDQIIKKANKIYSRYGQSKDKIYFVDALYYYQQIDYKNLIEKIDEIKVLKEKNIETMRKRIYSIMDCVRELERYKILYTSEEAVNLYYGTINLKAFIKKIEEEKTIEKYYFDCIKIENTLIPIVQKIWKYYINTTLELDSEEQHWFLVENFNKGYQKKEKHCVVVNLITNDKIMLPTDDNRYQYGFVYQINEQAILYESPNNIVYKEYKNNDEINNINTISNENITVEVEEQQYSRLFTPRKLMMKTIEEKTKCNQVLLDKNNSKIVAVYAIANGEEENISSKKAIELAEKFDLPFIKIESNIESL